MPKPTFLCVICVCSATLQFLKFCAEKSSALRQFSSARLIHCTAVILMPMPTFLCVIRVGSVTLQLLNFCAEKSPAFRQFSSAFKLDCTAVILRPRPTFPCVVRAASVTLQLLNFWAEKIIGVPSILISLPHGLQRCDPHAQASISMCRLSRQRRSVNFANFQG